MAVVWDGLEKDEGIINLRIVFLCFLCELKLEANNDYVNIKQ